MVAAAAADSGQAALAGHVAHSGQAAPTGLIGFVVLAAVVVWLILASIRRKRS